jgi:hypothetical protein
MAAYGPERLIGQLVASSFLKATNIGQETRMTQKKYEKAFERRFESWDADRSGYLSEAQLADGFIRS